MFDIWIFQIRYRSCFWAQSLLKPLFSFYSHLICILTSAATFLEVIQRRDWNRAGLRFCAGITTKAIKDLKAGLQSPTSSFEAEIAAWAAKMTNGDVMLTSASVLDNRSFMMKLVPKMIKKHHRLRKIATILSSLSELWSVQIKQTKLNQTNLSWWVQDCSCCVRGTSPTIQLVIIGHLTSLQTTSLHVAGVIVSVGLAWTNVFNTLLRRQIWL